MEDKFELKGVVDTAREIGENKALLEACVLACAALVLFTWAVVASPMTPFASAVAIACGAVAFVAAMAWAYENPDQL